VRVIKSAADGHAGSNQGREHAQRDQSDDTAHARSIASGQSAHS
jgi:hypothetical protein